MSRQINLLGALEITEDGHPAAILKSPQGCALLSYLLITQQAHSREVIADVLWDAVSTADSLRYLRKLLHRVRPLLPEITITRREIAPRSDADSSVDLYALQAALAASDPEELEHALQLYRDELLAGFYLPGATNFNEWLLLERERWRLHVWDGYRRLCAGYWEQAAWSQGIQATQRWLALDPLDEEVMRQRLRFLAADGQFVAALDHYAYCQHLLWEELGVEPEAATVALAAQIETAHQQASAVDIHHLAGSTLYYWGEAPVGGAFFGREAELDQMARWLTDEPAHLIVILGIGGQGKTSLAAQAVRAHVDRFASVYWRSLINAPPIESVLADYIRFLTHNQQIPPTDVASQLVEIRRHLQSDRHLLIFDNLETILDAERPGHFRHGYGEFEQVLQLFGGGGHQSTLLITSREAPWLSKQLAFQSPGSVTLRLDGLQASAGAHLLAAANVDGSTETITALVQHYSGNPLALRLVAETVDELYFGDVGAFLADEALIFDDIRTVLDQQFARLAPLEQEIFFWLATAREPLSLAKLRAHLLHPPRQRRLIDALRHLQRRSLIERSDAGFGLQNVITEYLTDRFVERAVAELTSGELHLLHRHALLQAQAKEHVRQSQARLVLAPIAHALAAIHPPAQLVTHLQAQISHLQETVAQKPSYAAGNLLNLLRHGAFDLTGYDFSQLEIRAAYLKGAALQDVNFAGAHFVDSVFTDDFGNVHAIAFSPDGQLVAAGTKEGEIRLWHRQNRQLHRVLSTDGESIWSIVFSPGGQLLAAANADHCIRVWKSETGQLHQLLQGHEHAVWSIDFSPDGNTLASASHDRTIRLWDVQTGEQRLVLDEDNGAFYPEQAVAFSPDGQTIAATGKDFAINLWDVPSGTLRQTLVGHTDIVEEIAFSPDGSTLVSGGHDHAVRLWDVRTGQMRHLLAGHTNWVKSVDFHNSGTMVASGSYDRSVRIWDVETGQLRHTLMTRSAVWSVVFSPDGHALVGSGLDYTLHEWDVQTWQLNAVRQGHTGTALTLTYSADGQTLITGHADGSVCVWEVVQASPPEMKLRQTWLAHEGWTTFVTLSPDGQTLATGGIDSTVRVWAAETGRPRHRLRGHGRSSIFGGAFSPDNQFLVTAGADESACIWEVQTGQLRRKLKSIRGVLEKAAITPDGHLLILTGSAPIVQIWNLPALLRADLPVDTALTTGAQPSHAPARPDGAWDDGAICRALHGHTEPVYALTLRADGQLLATGSHDLTVRLWDVPTIAQEAIAGRDGMGPRALRQVFKGHTSWIWAVAFSPDGTLLASCSEDQTVRVWDVQNGAERLLLRGHTQFVFDVTFSPDGRTIVSSGGDETIRFWDVGSGRCLKILHKPGPYAGMNITHVSGITQAQRATLTALGAVECQ